MLETDPTRCDPLPAGTSLHGYTLEAVVGHGRFAIVYRAQHAQPGPTVAIKEYLPTELAVREGAMVWVRNPADNRPYQEGLRRFREEARDLIHFQAHPGVVSCRDCFRANGTAYMVMDYEEGRTLAEVLATREAAGRPFEEADVLGVMVPLLEALQCVHEAGLLHRDLKPSNILIRESDNRPVLMDFGAAKQVVANQSKSMAPYTKQYGDRAHNRSSRISIEVPVRRGEGRLAFGQRQCMNLRHRRLPRSSQHRRALTFSVNRRSWSRG